MRSVVLMNGLLLLCIGAAPTEEEAADAPRVSGTLSFTCTPDAKSKAAGATAFDDTLELGDDRVKSKALTADGFAVALCIPKIVNGVPTFDVAFKKEGATAKYFIRAKKGGAASGSFTRSENGKTLRYTIGATIIREAADVRDPDAAKNLPGAAAAMAPAVLRVNGAFVRLMTVPVAMAEAQVKADKAKVAAILKEVGDDHNAQRFPLLEGTITAEQYVKQSEARLDAGWKSMRELLGEKAATSVEQTYEKPYTAVNVYLNQVRAAVAELGDPQASKSADKVVQKYLAALAALAKQPKLRTPEGIAQIKAQARKDVAAALEEKARERFEKIVAGMTGAPTSSPSP